MRVVSGRARPLFLVVLMSGSVLAAETELAPVLVVASRVEQPLAEIVGSVTWWERERIETRLLRDIRDLARYEASIAVTEDVSRFGAQGFAIRGLDGNRVSVELDGVPLGDGFAVGSFSRAGRNLVDPELLERVEFLRGPASSLYGSDALAGVVVMRTRDPVDVLRGKDGNWSVGGRIGYDSRDQSSTAGASLAAVHDDWQVLLTVNNRQDHERDNMPRSGGLRANPAQGDERFALAKWIYETPWLPGRITLGADAFEADVQTDVRSLVAGPGQYATTTRLDADDHESRARLSTQWSGATSGGWFDSWNALIYAQDASVEQRTQQDRRGATPAAAATRRDRLFQFDTHQLGVEGLIAGSFAQQRWLLGFDYARSRIEELRDGSETNLVTGVSSSTVIGERLPVRDFPTSVVQEFGLYTQDEIKLTERWFLLPALRYDHHRVEPQPDALWREDNPNTAVATSQEESLTPKLGARFSINPQLGLYAQYTRGFRAAPFSDVNIGLNIPAFGYSAIPNPDLRPERSHGLEVGLRWQGQSVISELALFDNRYRDLIESRVNLGRDPISGLLVFQSLNRDRARIRGAEFSAEGDFSHFGWTQYGFNLSASSSQGDDTRRDVPLNAVEPGRLIVGVNRSSLDARHRFELVGRFAQAKTRIDTTLGDVFRPPGYGVFDLFWHYQPSESVRIDTGLNNIANKRYWQWSSVRGLAVDAREVDLATQSGRSLMFSLRIDR